MALTVKQRRWILGVALAFTLSAVAALEGKDEATSAIVQSSQPRHVQQGGAENELTGNIPLEKLNRQPLPEDAKDIFAGQSWHVAPPPTRAAPPAAPPLPFVYMGKLAEEGEKVVVLLARQDRNYTVREGDVLDNMYRVDELRAPVMTLTYLPLNIKQTIRIGESN